MSKRSNSNTTTPQKRKKVKNDTQLRLDGFLSPSKGKAILRRSSQVPEVIDVDALEDESDPVPSGPSSQSTDIAPAKSQIPTRLLTFGAKAASQSYSFGQLDLHPALFNPDNCSWPGDEAPYAFLAHAMVILSNTKSRNTIINTLTNVLSTLLAKHPGSLVAALYLVSNSLSPPYTAVELGIGSSVLFKAIQHVSGLSATSLRHLQNTHGDVGDVAFAAKSKVQTLVPHAPLTLRGVYESMLKISRCRGQGASQQKQSIVEKLLVAGKGEEVRYLVRTLSQNLRVGAVRTSILTALARAIALRSAYSDSNSSICVPSTLLSRVAQSITAKKKTPESTGEAELKAIFMRSEAIVKEVYVQHPCYDDIVAALLEHGLSNLKVHVPLTVGIPLHPALGSPTRSLDEIYQRLGSAAFTAEFKYDGQRAQIHVGVEGDKPFVKIFSRHLEDMTTKYPDIIALMEFFVTQSSSTSFILDAEIVAIDPDSKEVRSFQELSNRSRKDVRLEDIKVPVCVYAFDLLYHDAKPLLTRSFKERREFLHQHFAPLVSEDSQLAHFAFVESCESSEGLTVVTEFWERAVASQCEGLMIKVLESATVTDITDTASSTRASRKSLLPATYEPDKRTSAWLKLKKDYVDGVGDSLDLIPIGAWYGSGRKANWFSPILLAIWDNGKPVALCKVMSGFIDAFYRALTEKYSLGGDNCSEQPLWECELGGYKPDVFFNFQEVWECRGADITESPISVAARGLIPGHRGLSLRFPRFIRTRPDKGIEQASTPQFLANLWGQQRGKATAVGGVDEGELVDYVSPESEAGEDDDDLEESDST